MMSSVARRSAMGAVSKPLQQIQGYLSVLGGTRNMSTNEPKDNILPVSQVEEISRTSTVLFYGDFTTDALCTSRESPFAENVRHRA